MLVAEERMEFAEREIFIPETEVFLRMDYIFSHGIS